MTATPRLTRDDVAHVANLARLTLTDDELDAFTGQLADVLDHAADLEALDLDDVSPMANPFPLVNVLRADEPGHDDVRAEILAAAPLVEDGQFRVPPVLGEAP
ncbi:MAG: Asp-tRNA(Asn)/Glu-tRNA(Gln) amidotransferase subunit GatC [Actinomycetota bacterium]|nr:Asp-tRNA(Asn)/Glu-tRNA(Gln) amidotransferase subunit GatC [Actinomycetota bacterium]MED5584598.1 Asp-tRNA(Asn)/Glu-tRNA(Gln) amidotransferase subunit GatC [Actinomycetota bacterium]MEE3211221.1 Asp-tRNA(Asn)/Glu-tRNA(Gln) amidotransferase subunit GatC [Actinomycetota bacterium]